ncbi:MAG: hypothetical protein [Bacteriophage sp.]|nr:MAG: hypothetical protein [Bacteriophage sp.]
MFKTILSKIFAFIAKHPTVLQALIATVGETVIEKKISIRGLVRIADAIASNTVEDAGCKCSHVPFDTLEAHEQNALQYEAITALQSLGLDLGEAKSEAEVTVREAVLAQITSPRYRKVFRESIRSLATHLHLPIA